MKNVLEFVESAAEKFPNKVAFADDKNEVTYSELLKQSKAVGTELSKLNVKNTPIAVLISRSAANIVGMLGVVYSGNFYIVLDPEMPAARANSILHTLNAKVVVADSEHMEKANTFDFDGDIINFENSAKTKIDDEKLNLIRNKMIDTDPLYALFTSGSTGAPKGAVLSHKNVISYATWVTETFDINEDTIFGNQTPFYFSMSVLDIFSSLKAMATINVIPKQYFSFPMQLIAFLNERKINTIYWVPSALSIIANWKVLDYSKPEFLKKVLFAGEVMPTKQLNYWISKMPDLFYANLYGPTEVTDICAYYVVNRKFRDDEVLPIGKACNNCDVFIIKDDGTEAAPGEEGELCARGSFLAMGYYNNDEKTKSAFVQNPLNKNYPELIYKTGDLVKYNELGELIYITRKDFQIKHMGYRIELGEIEAAGNAVEGMRACVCIYNSDEDKIVMVYEGSKIDDKKVFDSIKDKLPTYMMPNVYVKTNSIPHNQNGKLDRAWLKKNYKTLIK